MLPPGFSLLAYPPPLRKGETICFSNFLGRTQRPSRGRSAGPHFSTMRNGGKNRLGRSPLRTSLGYEAAPAVVLRPARDPCCGPCYCHHTRLSWQLALSPGGFHLRAYLGKRRSRRREPGCPSLGTAAYQGKALAIEACAIREVDANRRTESHLCDPSRTRAETRRTQVHPVPRGGFHKAGEGPAFGGSLVTFCPPRKSPQRSVPTGGAGLRLRHRGRTGPRQSGLSKPRPLPQRHRMMRQKLTAEDTPKEKARRKQ